MAVMVFICSFMTQQIPVCSCFFVKAVAFLGFFSNRKSDGTVWITVTDLLNDIHNLFICKIRIFSSLEYKGTKAQFISIFAAV